MRPHLVWNRPKPVARFNWASARWCQRGSSQRQLHACPRCTEPMFSRKLTTVCNACQRQLASERRAVHREALRKLGLLAPAVRATASTYKQAQRRAIALVSIAKATGKLPYLDGTTICVDCKRKRATVYDHRDYLKPLQVDAVCHHCNVRRGPALWVVPRANGTQTELGGTPTEDNGMRRGGRR
jgi:hypothetical protein